jgi:hypothetical protein
VKLRQRNTLRYELAAKYRRKDLQDKLIAEANDKIVAGREQVRILIRQSMTARDVERRRQASRPVGTPHLECLDIFYAPQ